METLRFRHNVSIAVLGVVMLCGGLALATSRWYLAPLLLVPLVMIAWSLRSGTDVDANGVRIRALVGSRRLSWPQIDGFTPQGGRVLAQLTTGRAVILAAVTPADLPRLLAAGGQPSTLPASEQASEPDDEPDSDTGTGTGTETGSAERGQ